MTARKHREGALVHRAERLGRSQASCIAVGENASDDVGAMGVSSVESTGVARSEGIEHARDIHNSVGERLESASRAERAEAAGSEGELVRSRALLAREERAANDIGGGDALRAADECEHVAGVRGGVGVAAVGEGARVVAVSD